MKIKCTRCGQMKGVRKSVFLRRVEKAGGVAEKVTSTYLCSACRKVIKEEAKKAEAKKKI